MNKYTKERFLKWNKKAVENEFGDSNLTPMWVADMDFKVSLYMRYKLIRLIKNGVFGYSADTTPELYYKNWLIKRHNVEVETDSLIATSGSLISLSLIIENFVEPNGKVCCFNPSYYMFKKIVERLGRRYMPFDFSDNGQPFINMEDFSVFLEKNGIECLIFCNPNNPLGYNFDEEFIISLLEVCKKRKILIIADEIHADFCFKQKHHFIFEYNYLYDNCISILSPSKTFGVPSLKISYIACNNLNLKKQILNVFYKYSLLNPNCVAREMVKQLCDKSIYKWHLRICNTIESNIIYLKKFFNQQLLSVKIVNNNSTYLLWLDFKEYLRPECIKPFFLDKCRIAVEFGDVFGEKYSTCIRINVACKRKNFKKNLKK